MNTTEHLERIAAKCREKLIQCGGHLPVAEAGWKSTIAAVEHLQRTGKHDGFLAGAIIAAWPEEIL